MAFENSSPLKDSSTSSVSTIDEALYSRQLYVLGLEAMKRMGSSDILILGLQGLGAEVAKNLVLAGVKSVTLFDPNPVTLQDLATQFFLKESDVGKSRAEATAPRLAELNAYVAVHVLPMECNLAQEIGKYHVVVLLNSTQDLQLQINDLVRQQANTKFISVNLFGLFGSLFCDFGDEFTVIDQNGENPVSGIIASIDENGNVTITDESRHGLVDGDYVSFKEIKGFDSLNGDEKSFKVTVNGPFTFNIGKISDDEVNITGGTFQQRKMPKTLKFKSLKKALIDPSFVYSDDSKMDRAIQIHIGFQAIHRFVQENNQKLPRAQNEEDADIVISHAKHIFESMPKQQCEALDEKLIRQISHQALGDLSPMVAFFGSMASQEALKAISGKYHPIHQFMYFDALECLPEDGVTADDCQPMNTRYDGQIAVFGKKFQEKVSNFKTFLVGAGAIGCEMVKNFAMMGIGCGSEGKVYVTDMDSIEKSNLNRQFLFRPNNVGQLKSTVAASRAKEMNPAFKNIVSFQDKVGVETEHIFNEEFFQKLDCIVNALDNVDARTYVDSRCVSFRKPLIDSGTLGTKGNTQVVYPYLTESYSSSHDPPEKSFPMCTIKNFPNQIEHTIAWARDLFEGYFKQYPENVNMYLTTPDFIQKSVERNSQKPVLESIQKYLVTEKPLTFEDCIEWARREFDINYRQSIAQLLYNFPTDAVTDNGALFWSGPKRAPHVIEFDINDRSHIEFVVAAANLHAYNYGLRGSTDLSFFIKTLNELPPLEEFKPKSNVHIKANDDEPSQLSSLNDEEAEIDDLIKKLPPPTNFAGLRLKLAEFEKDDDTNFHIDFVTAASNLRAQNYSIEPVSRLQTKFIAGKIIPAIATTTSLVTGLACLELYKVIGGVKEVSRLKNAFVNLALPFVAFSEPLEPPKNKITDELTLDLIWDKVEVEDMTLGEFLKYFENKYKLKVTMVSYGVSLIYAGFLLSKAKLDERISQKMSENAKVISKKPLPAGAKSISFEIAVEDESGEDVDFPAVTLKL